MSHHTTTRTSTTSRATSWPTVLFSGTDVVLVEPSRDGRPAEPVIGMLLSGRINQTSEQTEILYLFDENGAAAIISELVGWPPGWARAPRLSTG
jgi:hypothetical protein